ncbi:MAG: CRISPR-associated helicase Cas3' [Bryobacterales bacterium]|nr:CRISPR-associated helicase Cas3' [Bryobacterales bacterium]
MEWSEVYGDFFEKTTKAEPYAYQLRVAARLLDPAGGNLLLRIPTGCGKTSAAVIPFLFDRKGGGSRICARRLIYVLPMRTLVRSIERDICDLIATAGIDCSVTVQTGEEPGDPYLNQGDIVITTFDQFLSGMLCDPYGLSSRQFNVNAAAPMGNLVVFDEFHLMEPDKAFLTSAAMMHLFGRYTRSVWMTATATSPLAKALEEALRVEEIPFDEDDARQLPAIAQVSREIVRVQEPIGIEHLRRHQGKRVVVVVNQVKRAQELFRQAIAQKSKFGGENAIRCLHSRFFRSDRSATEAWLREAFAKGATDPALLITTQVVEAGVDISAEVLLTEMAPANSLMQRAGRCARYPGQSGAVEVYNLPDLPRAHLPYSPELLRLTEDALREGSTWSPAWAKDIMETVHREDDNLKVKNQWKTRLGRCHETIQENTMKPGSMGVAGLIREGSNQVRVVVARMPTLHHSCYEPVQVHGKSLSDVAAKRLDALRRWDFDVQQWTPMANKDEADRSLIVAITPDVAGYTRETGLSLMDSTDCESPVREREARKGWRPIRKETWEAHAARVSECAAKMLEETGTMVRDIPISWDSIQGWMRFVALTHDLGKLQISWQQWARGYQERKTGISPATTEFLAHTDFDYNDPEDRRLQQEVNPRRPNHSEASTWYASTMARGQSEDEDLLKPAALLAVVGHHGGWWNRPEIEPLAGGSQRLFDRLGLQRPTGRAGPKRAESGDFLEEWLKGPLTDPNQFRKIWPLAALFVRILRLADQASLEEANADR